MIDCELLPVLKSDDRVSCCMSEIIHPDYPFVYKNGPDTKLLLQHLADDMTVTGDKSKVKQKLESILRTVDIFCCRYPCCSKKQSNEDLRDREMVMENLSEVMATIFEGSDLTFAAVRRGLSLLRMQRKVMDHEARERIILVDNPTQDNLKMLLSHVLTSPPPNSSFSSVSHLSMTQSIQNLPSLPRDTLQAIQEWQQHLWKDANFPASFLAYLPSLTQERILLSLPSQGMEKNLRTGIELQLLPLDISSVLFANTYFLRFMLASYGWKNYTLSTPLPSLFPSISSALRSFFFLSPLSSYQQAFIHISRIAAKDLLLSSTQSNPFCPAYFLCLDHLSNSLVLVCRGSFEPPDILTDIFCRCIHFQDGFAHSGFVAGACWVLANVRNKIDETMKQYPNYKLILVGHSLGAAVAVIASFELLLHYPSLHVFAYGTPLCLDPRLAKESEAWVTNISVGEDLVCSLSYATLCQLRQNLIEIAAGLGKDIQFLNSEKAKETMPFERQMIEKKTRDKSTTRMNRLERKEKRREEEKGKGLNEREKSDELQEQIILETMKAGGSARRNVKEGKKERKRELRTREGMGRKKGEDYEEEEEWEEDEINREKDLMEKTRLEESGRKKSELEEEDRESEIGRRERGEMREKHLRLDEPSYRQVSDNTISPNAQSVRMNTVEMNEKYPETAERVESWERGELDIDDKDTRQQDEESDGSETREKKKSEGALEHEQKEVQKELEKTVRSWLPYIDEEHRRIEQNNLITVKSVDLMPRSIENNQQRRKESLIREIEHKRRSQTTSRPESFESSYPPPVISLTPHVPVSPLLSSPSSPISPESPLQSMQSSPVSRLAPLPSSPSSPVSPISSVSPLNIVKSPVDDLTSPFYRKIASFSPKQHQKELDAKALKGLVNPQQVLRDAKVTSNLFTRLAKAGNSAPIENPRHRIRPLSSAVYNSPKKNQRGMRVVPENVQGQEEENETQKQQEKKVPGELLLNSDLEEANEEISAAENKRRQQEESDLVGEEGGREYLASSAAILLEENNGVPSLNPFSVDCQNERRRKEAIDTNPFTNTNVTLVTDECGHSFVTPLPMSKETSRERTLVMDGSPVTHSINAHEFHRVEESQRKDRSPKRRWSIFRKKTKKNAEPRVSSPASTPLKNINNHRFSIEEEFWKRGPGRVVSQNEEEKKGNEDKRKMSVFDLAAEIVEENQKKNPIVHELFAPGFILQYSMVKNGLSPTPKEILTSRSYYAQTHPKAPQNAGDMITEKTKEFSLTEDKHYQKFEKRKLRRLNKKKNRFHGIAKVCSYACSTLGKGVCYRKVSGSKLELRILAPDRTAFNFIRVGWSMIFDHLPTTYESHLLDACYRMFDDYDKIKRDPEEVKKHLENVYSFHEKFVM